jgi:molybdopterin adenylyltransferase
MTDAAPRAGVVTVSDAASRGEREDRSGPEASRLLDEMGFEVVAEQVVSDDTGEIASALRRLADEAQVALVITTGGTGVAPRDVTPEATAEVCDRTVPGIAELIRSASFDKTPHAALSRSIAGIRGRTLIVNLPGSPGGVTDGLLALREVLPHAVRLIGGAEGGHFQT